MSATTTKAMKLVMKMLWNSFASDSVRPDNEPVRSSVPTAIRIPSGVMAVTAAAAHLPRGGGHHDGEPPRRTLHPAPPGDRLVG